MKAVKQIIIIFIFLAGSMALLAQATKPSIMVVPSDNWCITHGFSQTYENQGKTKTVPDYQTALQNSSDLITVINTINTMMGERGFPLENLEDAIAKVEANSARDAMLTGKSGAEIAESPLDKLNKVAKADIVIKMTWTVNQVGPKRSITFNLQGIDAYTSNQVAGASGTGGESFTSELAILLEEAVLSHIDNFNAQLMSHFEDMAENGREIVVNINVWDDFEDGLEAEYDGEELGDIIKMWMKKNTVKGRFKTGASTENRMPFTGVRIPLFEEIDGETYAVEPDGWLKKLSKFLKKKYQIQSKVIPLGLGEVQLVIGGK